MQDNIERDTRNDFLKKRGAYALTAPGGKIEAAREFESEVVAKMLLDGQKSGTICRFMSQTFNMSERTAKRRIKRAWEILREFSDNDIENHRAVTLNRLDYLYREAKDEYEKSKKFKNADSDEGSDGRSNGDRFISSNLRKEMMVYSLESAKLQGLYETEDKDKGNNVFIINGNSIEELAKERTIEVAPEGIHRQAIGSGGDHNESADSQIST